MPFLFYRNTSEHVGAVTSFVYNEVDMTDEMKKVSIQVDVIPEQEVVVGKNAELRINLQTNELYYVYLDRPLNNDEKIEQLETQMESQQSVINFILGV